MFFQQNTEVFLQHILFKTYLQCIKIRLVYMDRKNSAVC